MSFTYLKRDCPVCQGQRTDCRQSDSGLVFCRAEVPPPRGWQFVGEDRYGFGLFALDDGQASPDWRRAYLERKWQREQEQLTRQQQLLSLDERDRNYRVLPGFGFLASRHHQQLLSERKLTAGMVEFAVAQDWLRTWHPQVDAPHASPQLAGVNSKGFRRQLGGTAGIGIAALTLDGHISGYQIAADQREFAKYIWLSSQSKGGNGPHLPNGELPLFVWQNPEHQTVSEIWLVEGALKSLITALRCWFEWNRPDVLIIGAAGANWVGGTQQIEVIRRQFPDAVLRIVPDAGAVSGQIFQQYQNALDTFAIAEVLWWQQVDKEAADIDERNVLPTQIISADEFCAIAQTHQPLSPVQRRPTLSRRQRRQQQRRQHQHQYLSTLAKRLGVSAERGAIAQAFHQQQSLMSDATDAIDVSAFPALTLPDTGRRLFVLDGQKGTRKTSTAIASVVNALPNARGVIFVPTRLLGKNASKTLGIPCIWERQAQASPWVIACPESAWRLCSMTVEVVILDEANEDLHRNFEGHLGKHPQACRLQFKRALEECRLAIIAQDGLYRATLAAVQRLGRFDPQEVETLQRQRPTTPITIQRYQDPIAGEFPDWDGLAQANPAPQNLAFYTWLQALIAAVETGQRVVLPCGSQTKARHISRLLRLHFGRSKRIQVFDGKDSFKGTQANPNQPYRRLKHDFARDPDRWLEHHQPDVFIYSPCFNSGLSVATPYFDVQFECISPFETASHASQRGERIRDAIWGQRITERHIYLSSRGLSAQPPQELFFTDYWQCFIRGKTAGQFDIANGLLKQFGAESLVAAAKADALDELQQCVELPELLAIQAREIYFKPEYLQHEWQRNGWLIEDVVLDSAAAATLAPLWQEAQQQIICQRSRTLARCSRWQEAIADSESGDEAGPIQAVRLAKQKLAQIIGADCLWLNDAQWLEAWHIADAGALEKRRIRALVQLALESPALWQDIQRRQALRLIGQAAHVNSDEQLTLPASPREIELAQLLLQCPGIPQLLQGELTQWDKHHLTIRAAARYSREHAERLAHLSRHAQRIHGLAFTNRTPDIKCWHKLLSFIGIDSQRLGKQQHVRQYGLLRVEDLQPLSAQPTHAQRRRQYRLTTEDTVLQQIQHILQQNLTNTKPQWEAFQHTLLERWQGTQLQSVELDQTEVVSQGAPVTDLTNWLTPAALNDVRSAIGFNGAALG